MRIHPQNALLSPRLQPWVKTPAIIRASAPEERSLPRRPIFAIVPLLLAALPLTAQRVTLRLPETGATISINFGRQPDQKGLGSFRISSTNHEDYFKPKNPILRIADTAAERLEHGTTNHINGLKLDPSRYFFYGSYTSDSGPHTLLFFVGESGIGAAPVLVIGFTSNGKPYRVLERDELDINAVQSTSTGTALIIGKTSLSEVMWTKGDYDPKLPYATTYDPYSVFVVRPESPAVYSVAWSRAYNLRHYVWQGPQVSEKFGVMYNVPGHARPFAVPAERVDKVLGGGTKAP